ncbi:DNA methyltransferase [Arcobacter peruensis]|uniref:DNA methyltransferase n=1 Tax=Arcobacter peruensis TaxID=2320140 RepID=UPI000F075488|nr:DNA methyltransferase [Arcobacter peruensis]
MTEKQEKLIKLLEDMFQLNQTDLDFGIYRIMNAKADEIKQFMQKDLIESIKNAFTSNNNDGLQKELDELISNITNAGMNPDDSPKVKELKEKLSSSTSSQSHENEVYSYLSNFFSRYYKDGDFVSLRRYKKDTYAVPYEGEEVKLHWANSDQYYIKTSEFFRDYTFKIEDKTYHFKIVEADTEKNNNKASDEKERRFVLDYEYPVYEEDGELFIRFEYKHIGKEKQEKLNDKAVEAILKEENLLIENLRILSPTTKNKTRTLLAKYLTDYTAKNSFDYFIHKDLKGFLTRELDFFIKNEILYIDDILEVSSSQIESSLNKVKTFKTIANKIIAFLTQLEEFQKKLWLKKKFVIDTNYCITLDKIPQKYHEEIFANDAQLKEWEELFSTTEKSDYLVVDTKFFNQEFKNRLLSEFDNIDEECDGILINSENFGALNLLQDRYKEQIKTVYIDPPYNAQSSEILYLNSYKNSSWLSLIENRVNTAKKLLKKEFVFITAIDEVENFHLGMMYNDLFPNCENSTISVVHNPTGQQGKNFSFTHEFAHFIYPYNVESIGLEDRNDKTKESKPDIRPLRNVSSGKNHLRESAANCFYPIFIKNGQITGFGDVCDDNFHPEGINETLEDNTIAVYPIDPSNIESKWVFARDTVESILSELTPEYNTKKGTWDIIRTKSHFRYKSLWSDKRYNANSWGSVILNNMFNSTPFTYPKSIYTVLDSIDAGLKNNSNGTVLDFFAGSGTTGHAIIKLNRKDNGSRKYILVEMGNYFDTVTKPRIQKAIYSDKWKDGKPQDKGGISQMFKYFKLESYEDSLNNLAFKNVDKDLFTDEIKEDYLLNYMLDYETNESLLNIDAFKTPFDYKLKIASSSAGETVETNVDLVETFNYLIGLKVKTRQMIKGYLVIEGQNLKDEKILIIWRNGQSNDELNSFFEKMDFTVYDREFDTIYVNGDNNLANLKKDEDHFKVKLIEEEFKAKMFGE